MWSKIKPEHFDFLGIVVFPLIFCYAYYVLTKGIAPSQFISWLLLLTGVFGTIIDGGIVYRYFIRKKSN